MEEDWALTLGLSGLAGEPGVFQEGSQLLTKREAAPPRPLGPLRRLQALQRPGRPSAPPPLVPVPPGNRRYPRWLKKASQSSPPWPLSVPPPIFPALAPPPGSSHPLSLGHRISWEASPCSAQRPWDFFPPIERGEEEGGRKAFCFFFIFQIILSQPESRRFPFSDLGERVFRFSDICIENGIPGRRQRGPRAARRGGSRRSLAPGRGRAPNGRGCGHTSRVTLPRSGTRSQGSSTPPPQFKNFIWIAVLI
ncbi:uncharacterized protein LOC116577119 isoform X2 [Mustela erminea]|uniref:uncharacterized protein LOC116577119 isoform X2 n=1 Tax=Mustela erminea TaxID=36723 RepID=UPI0013869354|nr:uncharacterized protein LOC116577119 isoform X2 [Mustela erminea]